MKDRESARGLFWILAGLLTSALVFSFMESPGPSAAAPSSVFMQYLPMVMQKFPIQTIFGIELSQLAASGGLSQTVAANSTWIRRNGVQWSAVETSPGVRNWGALASLESELAAASSQGLQTILIVRSTPTWAQKVPGSYCGPIQSAYLPTFATFMRDLVVRYSGPPYNVKYWEIWNEPDIDPVWITAPDSAYGCWGDKNDPYYGGGYYGQMLQAVYPVVKAAIPTAQILVGGLLLDCNPSLCSSLPSSLSRADSGRDQLHAPDGVLNDPLPPKFLEGVLKQCGGTCFDGVSFHAYDYYGAGLGQYSNPGWTTSWNTTGPALIAKSNYLRNLLNTYGASGKYLLNTELAIVCDSCTSDPTYEVTKAYYVAQVYSGAIAQGLRANLWYSMLGWRNSGLLNGDLSPRPAYTAYAFARNELLDASFVANITSANVGVSNVTGYQFHRGDRRVWVVWSLDGSNHTMTLPGVPLAVWDALGTPITPAASLVVGLKPLYLEWNP